MAATIITTHGTRRAVSSFSRRELVGSSFLAALLGAALTVVLLLSSCDDGAVAGTAPSADAGLLELCAACDALTQQSEALWNGKTRIAEDIARDVALMQLRERQATLLEQLCELRPITLQGHAARARTLLSWDRDTRWTQPADLEETLAAAVICDLAKSA